MPLRYRAGGSSASAARQLRDGRPCRRHFAAVCLGVLADLEQVFAALGEFSAHHAVDENHIAVGIVAAQLALALLQKAVITDPVGDVMRQPGAALRTVV